MENEGGILRQGRHYWRRERAQRVAFLVDGASYFGAVRAAALRAERSICILGWDIHSRMRLAADEATDDLPVELGAFLNALLAAKPRLQVHILVWDFAMIYAVQREILPLLNQGWAAHRRLRFHLDDSHPLGASHHQKVVTIDDRLAFVGGLDMTMRRWDTSEHRPCDPRRTDPDGAPYAPFHDMAMAVDGAAAAALSHLVRERWRRSGRRRPRPVRRAGDPWPPGLRADIRNADIAIARTEPAYGGRREVREVENLWCDALRSARRWIYLENQYLTAICIQRALLDRLAEPDGPEIVIVLPQRPHGWLEATALGDSQARLVRRLRAADRHHRLRLYYPVLPGSAAADDRWVRVHAKALVVDDSLLRIGSSNTSNRSMGVDTECDLAIEADRPATAAAVAGFRNRLLAEHLGRTAADVAAAIAAEGSLIRAIESLSTEPRGFASIDTVLPPDPLRLHEDDAVEANPFDPERPIRPERFLADFFPEAPPGQRLSRRALASLGYVAFTVCLLGAWAFTPLRQIITLDWLLAQVDAVRGSILTPLYVFGAFIFGGILLVPVTLLIAVTAVAFGPAFGFAYAALGAAASATAGFALGRLVGRDLVRRFAGRRLNRISRRLARSGILTVAALRLLPIAPFTLVNMVAGAMHLRYRDYMLGTMLGMLPGIVGMTALGTTVDRILRYGDARGFALFGLTLAALVGVGWGLQRWLGVPPERRAPVPGE